MGIVQSTALLLSASSKNSTRLFGVADIHPLHPWSTLRSLLTPWQLVIWPPNPHHPVCADSTGSELPGRLLLPIKVSFDEAFKTHMCQVWESCTSGPRPSNLIPRRGPRTLLTGAHDLEQLKALNPGLESRKDAVDCESQESKKGTDGWIVVWRGKYSLGQRAGFSHSFVTIWANLFHFFKYYKFCDRRDSSIFFFFF